MNELTRKRNLLHALVARHSADGKKFIFQSIVANSLQVIFSSDTRSWFIQVTQIAIMGGRVYLGFLPWRLLYQEICPSATRLLLL